MKYIGIALAFLIAQESFAAKEMTKAQMTACGMKVAMYKGKSGIGAIITKTAKFVGHKVVWRALYDNEFVREWRAFKLWKRHNFGRQMFAVENAYAPAQNKLAMSQQGRRRHKEKKKRF